MNIPKYCEFCQPLNKAKYFREYKDAEYYFCQKHGDVLGKLGIKKEIILDENQEEVNGKND